MIFPQKLGMFQGFFICVALRENINDIMGKTTLRESLKKDESHCPPPGKRGANKNKLMFEKCKIIFHNSKYLT